MTSPGLPEATQSPLAEFRVNFSIGAYFMLIYVLLQGSSLFLIPLPYNTLGLHHDYDYCSRSVLVFLRASPRVFAVICMLPDTLRCNTFTHSVYERQML